jgi:transcriptional regulator with XRE-family HTH domain
MTDTLKKLLKEYNISQRQVAERMGITPSSLSQSINAEDISISTLQGIADTINISLAELCAEMEQKHKREHKTIDELTLLRAENELLRGILAEKERTIQLLIGQKGE